MNQAGQEREVAEEVINFMSARLSETVRIDDLARAANYSKFHFCRLFRRATGITPSRFLSALRLKESRRLLLHTDLTVCDVSCEVGYNSVGTFTSRFTRGIGLPPSVFRNSGGYRQSDDWPEPPGGAAAGVSGELLVPSGSDGAKQFIVAAFPGPIPEGRPERCVLLRGPGRWALPTLPPGTWYLAAAALPAGDVAELRSPLLEERTQLFGSLGPIRVRPAGHGGPTSGRIDGPPGPLRLWMRPVRAIDPPILFAPPRHPARAFPVQTPAAA